MQLLTRDGYDFWTMASLFQKSIRRSDIPKASFAAWQLMEKYEGYLWNRMLIITAEDIGGYVGWAIIGLKIQQDMVKKHTNGKNKGTIFIAKAIELLCKSRKCRDACYIDCNYLWSDDRIKETLTDDDLEMLPRSELENMEIPSWVYDVHTYQGKKAGKTVWDMIRDEEKALEPKEPSLFGDSYWTEFEYKLRKEGAYRGS
jgi:replication-associated recombination protein RarA